MITKITYEDGRVEEVRVKPRHFEAVEDRIGAKVQTHTYKAGLMATWTALGCPGRYEEWRDTIDEFEQGDGVDPTSGGSPAGSPDSP